MTLKQRAVNVRARTASSVRSVHAVGKRLFRINLANTLTLLNGVAGFLSIIASSQGMFRGASLFILAGVLLDWLDGKAARFFNEESSLGRELDSLSDMITFGVAPAVLVSLIAPSYFAHLASALFVLSSALRLGRFNIQEMKGVFFGVPTTTNGFLLPALVFGGAPLIVYPWLMLIMALLMNAPLRIPKVL